MIPFSPTPLPDTQGNEVVLTRPVRLVFCITELDPGGAERALTQLVMNLDRHDWDPHVICVGPRGHFADVLESASVPVVCLNATGFASLPRVLYRLTREFRRLRPALVQTFLFHANILGRIAARLAGIKVVISGLRVAEKQSTWHGTVDRWTNFLVKCNVCVSQGVAEFSERVVGLDPSKLVVIPNSVEADLFAQAIPADMTPFGIPQGSRVFISVGRLDRQKGFDVLIEAVSLLDPLPDDVYFLIVGDGPESESLSRLVAQKHLATRIRFAGRRTDVPQLLAGSHAFVLSSRWEGMPNAVLEAMAAGLPVVATSVEGISELVHNGTHGIVVAPERPQELKTAIAKLLSQPHFASEAGVASQAIVNKEFTTINTTEAYAKLYLHWLNSSAG